MIQEITPQDGHCLCARPIIKKRPEALGDTLDTSFEIPHNIEQIVGILSSGVPGPSLVASIKFGNIES